MTLLVGSIFHMTRKIVSEMTYNVSMGTLNPTIPYHTIFVLLSIILTLHDLVQSLEITMPTFMYYMYYYLCITIYK